MLAERNAEARRLRLPARTSQGAEVDDGDDVDDGDGDDEMRSSARRSGSYRKP
jgi:hypothetical protein